MQDVFLFSYNFHDGFHGIFRGSRLRVLFCLGKSSGIFLHQPAGNHDLMSASHAFEPEISSHPEDFPLAAAAGVGLFKLYYIPNFIIVTFRSCHISISVYGSDRCLSPFQYAFYLSQLSSRLNARLSRAFTLSSNWAMLLAPMRTLVTSFLRSTPGQGHPGQGLSALSGNPVQSPDFNQLVLCQVSSAYRGTFL